MAETKVARRYAKSLLDLGKEKNITGELYSDMKLLMDTISQNRQLGILFKSPIVNTDKKDAILKELFGSRVNPLTLEFLSIITRKNREYYIEDIAIAFVKLYKIYKNIQPAKVITAAPIDETLRNRMIEMVKASSDSTVELTEIIDPSIIGGFILRWGDKQVDASVTSKLNSLRMDFSRNLYQKDY